MWDAAMVVALSILLLLAAALIPLIPTVVTYRMFPDTTVAVKGPLAGLTVRATGAFAAYVVAFILCAYFTTHAFDAFGSQLRAAWIVEGKFDAVRSDGKPASSDEIPAKAEIIITPRLYEIEGNQFRIHVPVSDLDQWPFMVVTVPGWGSANIDLDQLETGVKRNSFRKRIQITNAITVRQAVASKQYSPASGNYLNSTAEPQH